MDLSQVLVANAMVLVYPSAKKGETVQVDVDALRHMVLSVIAKINGQFRHKYGQLVIACDGQGSSWRRAEFVYYKANRKKDRDAQTIDWTSMFKAFDTIKQELIDFFPYRVIDVPTAEGDDVIATLVRRFSGRTILDDPILIVSGDRDFKQLQVFENVDQYDPVQRRPIIENSPTKYLFEHIIRGDRNDGVPNVLSADNCLVIGQRQKPVRENTINQWWNWYKISSETLFDQQSDEFIERFKRNQLMVDLSLVPDILAKEIVEQYQQQQDKPTRDLRAYLIDKRLKLLMEHVNNFYLL